MPKLPAVCCRVKSPDSDHVAVLAGQWGDLNYTKSHNLHFLGQHHDFWVIRSKVDVLSQSHKSLERPTSATSTGLLHPDSSDRCKSANGWARVTDKASLT